MTKVRVYELAKEYGMKGPAMAQLLKQLGFDQIKSHMAVLDDATELHARASLEAQGLKTSGGGAPSKSKGLRKKALPAAAEESAAAETSSDSDGLPTLKRKALPDPVASSPKPTLRKKLPEPEEAPAAPEPVAAPESKAPSAAEQAAVVRPADREAAAAAAADAEKAAEKAKAPAAAASPQAGGTPAASSPAKDEPAAKPSTPPAAKAPEAPTPAATTPAAESKPAAAPAAETPAAAAKPADPAPAESKPAAEAPAPAAASGQAPAAGAPADGAPTDGAPTDKAPTAGKPGGKPAGDKGKTAAKPAAGGANTTKASPTTTVGPDGVKRLLVPERRAKVVGRIELPQEAISDAKRRSAPSTGRNPGGVDRNLRQAALRNTQSRSALRTGVRRGPGAGGRRGPPGRGRPDGRGRKGRNAGQSGMLAPTVDPNKVVEIEPPITVKGMSEALGIKVTDLIAALTFKLGVAGKNINSFLSEEEVELVALEVNRKIKLVERKEAEVELLQSIVDASEDIDAQTRAPVLTFMGHVDHGKTTLLDSLRDSDVVKGEAGGITQHVGAYKITRDNGFEFVVLDTPGHAAFTQMRVRGAKLTDIVILVVAADDGVMPQTEEAIAHAKDAGTPVIVAITKSDTPGANSQQVMQQLAVKGLQAEEWGGDIQCVPVSALTGQGIPELVEQIMLQAEILELDAKADATGEGIVIESKQSPEQGVVVNALITNGTIRVRDQVLCGESLSRVRGIVNDHGDHLKEAGPSTPISLLGMTSLPLPGDKLFVVADKKKAKEVVDDRQRAARKMSLAERSAQTKVTMDNLSATLEAAKAEELKVIIKADVMGSLQPIKSSLENLNTSEVRVNIIHSALGGITESDVVLAEAGGAMIVGFNTVADQAARQAAERADVEIRYFDIIYNLIDELKLALEGKLKPEEVEDVTGHAEIKAIFRSSKIGNIAGLMVTDGLAKRNSHARLSRDGRVVYTGSVSTLRREKDDAKEVRGGYECGLTLKDFNDIKVGDHIEFFDIKYVKRTLA